MSVTDGIAAAWYGMTYAVDPEVGRDNVVMRGPSHMIVGPRAFRVIQWETEGREVWAGRDWRRLKRERRKFLAVARPDRKKGARP